MNALDAQALIIIAAIAIGLWRITHQFTAPHDAERVNEKERTK
jgi:hypothetical protein